MTSKTLRSFAGGLIAAASILGAVYFFGPGEANTAKSAEKPSTKEMKSMLASEGYVVHTKEEWDKQLAAVKDAKNKAEKATADNKNKAENKAQEQNSDKVVYKMMLSVSMGMTSIDVGNALVQGKIIDDAFAFSKEVENRGLANALRPGMYEVQSGMTMDEVISVVFK